MRASRGAGAPLARRKGAPMLGSAPPSIQGACAQNLLAVPKERPYRFRRSVACPPAAGFRERVRLPVA